MNGSTNRLEGGVEDVLEALMGPEAATVTVKIIEGFMVGLTDVTEASTATVIAAVEGQGEKISNEIMALGEKRGNGLSLAALGVSVLTLGTAAFAANKASKAARDAAKVADTFRQWEEQELLAEEAGNAPATVH